MWAGKEAMLRKKTPDRSKRKRKRPRGLEQDRRVNRNGRSGNLFFTCGQRVPLKARGKSQRPYPVACTATCRYDPELPPEFYSELWGKPDGTQDMPGLPPGYPQAGPAVNDSVPCILDWLTFKGSFFMNMKRYFSPYVFTSLKSELVLELIVSLSHRQFSPLRYTKEHLTIDTILNLEKYGDIYFACIRGAAWWTRHDFWNVEDLPSPRISNTLSFLCSGSPLLTNSLIFGKLIIGVSISSSYVSYTVLSEFNDLIYKVLERSLPPTLKHSVNNYYHFQIKVSKTDSCSTNTPKEKHPDKNTLHSRMRCWIANAMCAV